MARRKGSKALLDEVTRAQHELWHRVELDWLLRDYQIEMKKDILASKSLKYMLNSSRRLGKTTVLVMIALELALTRESAIQLTTSTQFNMRGIIKPIIELMTRTCPKELKPVFKGQDQCYHFPSTNSYMYLAGSNLGHEDDSRGRYRDLCIIDEGQNVDRLQYLIGSVLLPQTIDREGGRVIIAGTPPESVDHYFKELHDELQTTKDVLTRDVYYNTSIPSERLAEYKKEAGGEESTTWRREYLCQFVTDMTKAVVNPDHLTTYTTHAPVGYNRSMVSMDVGGADFTALLWGHYSFDDACVVIEKEWQSNQNTVTSEMIATTVSETCTELGYKDDNTMYVADNNNIILLQDLFNDYGLAFYPTAKDNLAAAVNRVKRFMKEGRLVIHEDCTYLIGCINGATWNKDRTKFKRSVHFGHYDLLSSLIYMVRNTDETTNAPDLVYDIHKYTIPEENEEKSHPLAAAFRRRIGR